MKDPTKTHMKTPFSIRLIRWVFCLVILIAIVAGLYVSGSPATRRRYALDERRVNSLSQIIYAIDNYAQTRGALPTNLETLAQQQPYLVTEIRDPASGAMYEYRAVDYAWVDGLSTTSTYELCATFDLPTSKDEVLHRPTPAILPDGGVLTTWDHPAGRTCFPLRARLAVPVVPLPTSKPSL